MQDDEIGFHNLILVHRKWKSAFLKEALLPLTRKKEEGKRLNNLFNAASLSTGREAIVLFAPPLDQLAP